MNKQYFRNPNLIIEQIEEDIYSVVNPFIRNGLKILNSKQLKILNHFSGQKSTEKIFDQNKIKEIDGTKLLDIFKEKLFIRDTNNFNFIIDNPIVKNINLWIHTTDSCNLNCSYCYINSKEIGNSFNEKTMKQLHLKLIETIQHNNINSITLRLAGGEPLIQFNIWKPFLKKLKAEIESYNCQFSVIFLTNLTILDDEIINFIKAKEIGIGVSLDGYGEYHNKTRYFKNGKGSFNIIHKNLLRLLEEGIYPTIMTVVSNENLDGLVEFTKFLIEKNLSFRYSLVQGVEFDYQKALQIFNKCFNLFENAIDNGYVFSKKFKLGDLKFFDIFYQTCGAGINTGAIYPDGRFYFCQKQVGNSTQIDTIYSKRDLISIISNGKFYNNQISDECNNCKYRFICTAGCPLERTNDKKSPACEFYKKMIPETYKLLGKERLVKMISCLKS